LQGGGGNDILIGGEGNDLQIGGDGRDILIGGVGSDQLSGNAMDDILIAGTTHYDNNFASLRSILTEWLGTANYATRVNTIKSGGGPLVGTGIALNDTTVHDDGVQDVLAGDQGQDWFLFNHAWRRLCVCRRQGGQRNSP
jgi:hypothetical protein